jgi:hypothetical protein
MTRWIVPSIAVLALLVVGVWLAGCSPEETETAAAPTAPIADAPTDTAPAAVHDVEGEYTYTCPMHPNVKQERPGKCPECGMFLVADTDEDVEYYCPMHENVVEEDPGKCPECGMFLEARPVEDDA